MTTVDTDAVLTLLQDVAAEVINPRFRALANHEVQEKNPGDLVTIADHEAEVLITKALQDAYPAAVILGEEAYAADPTLADRFHQADHAFTVDPVDGTKNFVNGSPDHAVMASEIRNSEVTRAWIWQPQHEAAYVAERGSGAYLNGVKLQTQTPGDPLRGHTSRRAWLGRQLGDLPELKLTWVSCGIDYPHLIAGDADFLVYLGTQPWDHAPGALLLHESGGYCGSLEGQPYRPVFGQSGLVAAGRRSTYDAVIALT